MNTEDLKNLKKSELIEMIVSLTAIPEVRVTLTDRIFEFLSTQDSPVKIAVISRKLNSPYRTVRGSLERNRNNGKFLRHEGSTYSNG